MYSKMFRVAVPFAFVVLLVRAISFSDVQAGASAAGLESTDSAERVRFQTAKRLLIEARVPFDAEELLKASWRRTLKTTLDRMPELQVSKVLPSSVRVASRQQTIYIFAKIHG